eukprot:1230182-Rhodomonas_salina.1
MSCSPNVKPDLVHPTPQTPLRMWCLGVQSQPGSPVQAGRNRIFLPKKNKNKALSSPFTHAGPEVAVPVSPFTDRAPKRDTIVSPTSVASAARGVAEMPAANRRDAPGTADPKQADAGMNRDQIRQQVLLKIKCKQKQKSYPWH